MGFPNFETLTIKPGFKIWVDGHTLDYDLEICYAKKLDCSATCCLNSYCGETRKNCINYSNRSYNELYIGIMVLLTIVVGIPTCVGTLEFLLNYKFCRYYDEEKDAFLGGLTVCEAFTYILTCGKAMEKKEIITDSYVYEAVEPVVEEEINQENVAPKPKSMNNNQVQVIAP